jgi:hypothetical protein
MGAAGCGKGTSSAGDMGMSAQDMSMNAVMDLSTPPDLSMPDLVPPPPPDMTPPTVTGLPTNCAAGTTAAMLYTNVFSPKCGQANCHNATGVHFTVTDAASMKAALVNVNADETSGTMARVKPSNVNQSFLMYKLMNQQLKVAIPDLAGGQMPAGGPMLDNTSLCAFISWIQGGAN